MTFLGQVPLLTNRWISNAHISAYTPPTHFVFGKGKDISRCVDGDMGIWNSAICEEWYLPLFWGSFQFAHLLPGDQPQNTALLSAELTSVRNLLESKQRELNQSMLKVDKITQALSDLQKSQDSSSTSEIGKLNRALGTCSTTSLTDFEKKN